LFVSVGDRRGWDRVEWALADTSAWSARVENDRETGRTLLAIFRDLEDPRTDQGKRHLLEEIIVIASLAVLSGADTWADIEDYGEAKKAWLETFLGLPHGIPSHDTFGRVFALIKPDEFERGFARWVEVIRTRVSTGTLPGQIAIDGKTARGSADRAKKLGPLHMVSAWAVGERLVLGQVATEKKGNEVTAIPALLDALELEGAVVTIDAIGCQKTIAAAVVDKRGDYILALKANHPTLHAEVQALWELVETDPEFADMERDVYETSERGHGREERRRVTVVDEVELLESAAAWKGLRSVALLEAWRIVRGKESYERRYYLTSLGRDGERIGRAIRGHWGIENGLHWCLDVTFREDQSRVRTGHAAENLARLRRMALNLLRHETTCKRGLKTKRARAGWDDNYLLKVLGL
jgi:predicted transposase YbfD/YdcC